MAGFLFRLETLEGEPAEPRELSSAVPNWAPGHEIHFGHKTLRVVAVRDDNADSPPVLVGRGRGLISRMAQHRFGARAASIGMRGRAASRGAGWRPTRPT